MNRPTESWFAALTLERRRKLREHDEKVKVEDMLVFIRAAAMSRGVAIADGGVTDEEAEVGDMADKMFEIFASAAGKVIPRGDVVGE